MASIFNGCIEYQANNLKCIYTNIHITQENISCRQWPQRMSFSHIIRARASTIWNTHIPCKHWTSVVVWVADLTQLHGSIAMFQFDLRYTMRNMQCVLKVLTVRRWFHSLNSKILNASCPVDQISYSRSYSISTKQNENIRGNFLFSFTFAPQSWIWSIQLVFLCIVYDLHLMRESKASVLGCRFTIALFFFVNSSESPAWNQWRCLWSLWKMLTADKI